MKHQKRHSQRSGFTLIELLVVIAIIGVLVSLTLPAVQASREASRRAQCLNNLKQQGLALHSYLTASDAFPIGYVVWANSPSGVAPGWAWATAILPQIEEATIYSSFNINIALDLAGNATSRTALLSVHVCPSDRNTGAFVTTSALAGGPVEARTTSYAANQGVMGSVPGNGLFLPNKSIRPKDVKDGLSSTFACGERGSFVVQNAWAGALSNGRGGEQVLAQVITPVTFAGTPPATTFSSPHTALIHFLMGDGSARPIKTSINPGVYSALATRNGRETIDAGAY
ncbi:MAG: DUF1559 domain-containing protein [Isosphaeraceae bacterium]|nr:DUF1559 domain-containing protein [Isosphaeraceae bacterium]